MGDQNHPYSCSDVWQRLDDYLDQELPSQEAYLTREHVRVCPACAAESRRSYFALAQLREAVQRLSLPPGLARRLSEWLDACRRRRAAEKGTSERERDDD
jgi:hypothetical protein